MSLDKRYDFVLLFDVQDGNPNGDPDAGNLPRMDPETGQGLVTDVCLKRKLRNYVLQAKPGTKSYDIFVKEKGILNVAIEEAHEQPDVKAKEGGEKTEAARRYMCARYFDVRTFGAVMSTGKNAGQVRGPVQLTFGRSVDPVLAMEHSITRMAVATEAEAEKQSGDNRTMGRKATLPYALYRAHGFVSPSLAAQTGFSAGDLTLLWEGLAGMFEMDRSAARGLMTARKLVVFEHENSLGNASAASLFERLSTKRKGGVEAARTFQDYEINLDRKDLPQGITVHERF
jgi:CRISPR-associated protein Csd2